MVTLVLQCWFRWKVFCDANFISCHKFEEISVSCCKVALGIFKLASDQLLRSNLPDVVQTILKNVCESIQSARPLLQQNSLGIEVSGYLCRQFIGFRFAHKISFLSIRLSFVIWKKKMMIDHLKIRPSFLTTTVCLIQRNLWSIGVRSTLTYGISSTLTFLSSKSLG